MSLLLDPTAVFELSALTRGSGGPWPRGVSDPAAKGSPRSGHRPRLGAGGLILPALLDIVPVLVPLAAVGLAMIMTGAATVTLRRQEFKHVVLNLTYLAMIGFVIFGRFGPESFG